MADKKNTIVEDKLKRIEELAGNLSIPKYNLLKINYLVKIIQDSAKYSNECTQCHKNLQKSCELIEKIPFLDDIEFRQPYEKEFNQIRNHFHKEHGYIPPSYFTSRFSIIGILAGMSITLISTWLTLGIVIIDAILAGFIVGLTAGYIAGAIKEKAYRKAKKII